jgi:hypothetical protein
MSEERDDAGASFALPLTAPTVVLYRHALGETDA